jgi:hypothetical protein
MSTPKNEPRLPIALSHDQLGLLENILKYYPRRWDYSESFYEDQKFVSDLKNFAKEAFPFTKRNYKLSVSETEAENPVTQFSTMSGKMKYGEPAR